MTPRRNCFRFYHQTNSMLKCLIFVEWVKEKFLQLITLPAMTTTPPLMESLICFCLKRCLTRLTRSVSTNILLIRQVTQRQPRETSLLCNVSQHIFCFMLLVNLVIQFFMIRISVRSTRSIRLAYREKSDQVETHSFCEALYWIYFPGDGVDKYYYPILFPVGIIGNILSFLVSTDKTLLCITSSLNCKGYVEMMRL